MLPHSSGAQQARVNCRKLQGEPRPAATAIASPQSNGMAEAFVKRDYADRMDRRDALTVLRQLEAAFEHYNEVHPHRALKMLSPRMFRQRAAKLSITVCPEI